MEKARLSTTGVSTHLGAENYYTSILLNKCGFEKISGWECLLFHRGLKVFLSVYVDDFKMAGCARNMPEAWKLMTDNGLKLDEPEPFGHYLGAGQTPTKINQDEVNKRMTNVRPLFEAPDAKDAAEADDDTDAERAGQG